MRARKIPKQRIFIFLFPRCLNDQMFSYPLDHLKSVCYFMNEENNIALILIFYRHNHWIIKMRKFQISASFIHHHGFPTTQTKKAGISHGTKLINGHHHCESKALKKNLFSLCLPFCCVSSLEQNFHLILKTRFRILRGKKGTFSPWEHFSLTSFHFFICLHFKYHLNCGTIWTTRREWQRRIKIHPNKQQGRMGDDVGIDDGGAQTNSLSFILHSSLTLTHPWCLRFGIRRATVANDRKCHRSDSNQKILFFSMEKYLPIFCVKLCLLTINNLRHSNLEWQLYYIRNILKISNFCQFLLSISYFSSFPDTNEITCTPTKADNSGFRIESN